MESTTLSPNGAAGADAAHSLADPAAERMLDTILATPFAEVAPPADLPPDLPPDLPVPDEEPAADPAAEPSAEPPAEEPPSLPEGMALFLPEGVAATEPDANPAPEPPTAEAEAPAAEAQPEPEAPAEPTAEPAQEQAEPTPEQRLKTVLTLNYQPVNFALFHGKAVEITGTHNEDTFFDGHYVTLDKTTGRIIAGNKIEQQPMSQLEPLRNATSLLRLRKGIILRAFDVLDGLLAAVGKEIEQVDACIETLNAAKTAIRGMLPDKGKDLVF